jgi:tRNA dimethylallyltransferase
LANEKGWGVVHQRLAEVDPEAAGRIHVNDPQRLQRALEVYEITGKSMTQWQRQKTEPCPFDLLEIAVVPPDRLKLHETIQARFHQMLDDGFVKEVQHLFERGDLNGALPSLKAVGYRQVWSYLSGEISYETMVEKAVIATRQLAKRQFTWLRSWQGLRQIPAPMGSEALKIIRASSILA